MDRGHRLVPRQRLRRPRRARRRAAAQGQPVFVEGRFQTREFEGKDGQKRTSLDVTADNVISLEARGQRRRRRAFGGAPAAAGAASGGCRRRCRRRRWRSRPPADDTDLDDLPF